MLILEKRCRIHLIIIPSSRIIDLFRSSVVRKCVNSHALFHVFFLLFNKCGSCCIGNGSHHCCIGNGSHHCLGLITGLKVTCEIKMEIPS